MWFAEPSRAFFCPLRYSCHLVYVTESLPTSGVIGVLTSGVGGFSSVVHRPSLRFPYTGTFPFPQKRPPGGCLQPAISSHIAPPSVLIYDCMDCCNLHIFHQLRPLRITRVPHSTRELCMMALSSSDIHFLSKVLPLAASAFKSRLLEARRCVPSVLPEAHCFSLRKHQYASFCWFSRARAPPVFFGKSIVTLVVFCIFLDFIHLLLCLF